jgi:formate dehydrogenase beta subunit
VAQSSLLDVAVPAENHHQQLISCQVACPVHTDARGYVRAIAEGDFERAYLIARGPNPFASICGRVCGAPCEVACRRGKIPRTDADGRFFANDLPISIRALKRFACEKAGVDCRPTDDVLNRLRDHVPEISADAEEMAALLRARLEGHIVPANGERVAIIGGGPAGLSAAHDLALFGLSPVVFEMEPVLAGMLALGVPDYRLPRDLINREIDVIRALGVEIQLGVEVGNQVSFAELREKYSAILIAVGAKRPRSLGIPGERGPQVFGGVDFLRAVSLGEEVSLGHDVIVIGGGNVAYDVARTVLRQAAYDAARTAKRLQGTRRVRLISLETLEEMPADTLEIKEGDEEGVERLGGIGPLEILRDAEGQVTGLRVRRCLRVYDADRRFAPVFDEADQQTLDCDTILFAAGQSPDLGFLGEGGKDIEEFRPGWPKVDAEQLVTTGKGVFVAGDLAHGTRLLIDAVASGKRAARSIYRYVTGRSLEQATRFEHIAIDSYEREKGYERIRRAEVPVRSPEERAAAPGTQVEIGFDVEQAQREASRCLDCGITPVFDGARCVLCGGCVDVCPTLVLKLVPLSEIQMTPEMRAAVEESLGKDVNLAEQSAIIKDEDRCIRCGLCAVRCPVQAITMEQVRTLTTWSTS